MTRTYLCDTENLSNGTTTVNPSIEGTTTTVFRVEVPLTEALNDKGLFIAIINLTLISSSLL